MGLFSDRSADAYRKAAEAVKAGTATEDQQQMNTDAAKQAGSFGQRARDAMK